MAQSRLTNETELLFSASNRLSCASSPSELLEAVSDFARSRGATRGVLAYCEQAGGERVDEIVAEWTLDGASPPGVGAQTRHSHTTLVTSLAPSHPEPLFFENLLDDDRMTRAGRDFDQRQAITGCVILPLVNKQRWIAMLTFGWDQPHMFTEQDRRMFRILQQLAAPVIDSTRLFEQTQGRTAELATTRREMDILYETSRLLTGAASPAELLDVISPYVREKGAVSGQLFYFDHYQPNWIEVVAGWGSDDAHRLPIGWRLDMGYRTLGQHVISHPEKPALIPDLMNSDLVGEDSRAIFRPLGVRGFVALPLNHNGRWIGAAYFFWDRPCPFDERDVRVLTAIQQNAAPVIDSIRLLDQSRARTAELEAANQEINLLYRTSEIINSANTYHEVVEAVSQFDPDAEVVTLMLWDTLDWATAHYLDIMVVIDRTGRSQLAVGNRLAKEGFPIAEVMLGERVWLFEDAHTDPRVDPVTAQSWELLDIRSFSGPALYINQHWAGGITFHSSQPRQFSERDRRLLAGVGDLVIAAILRIRSQQETLAAKDEIDTLYRVGERINAANTYHELVHALVGTIDGVTAVALYCWEGGDFETATHAEAMAATDYLAHIAGQRFPKEALSYTRDSQHERLIVLDDVAADPRLAKPTVTQFSNLKLQAAISIRLFVEQRWVGALVFHSQTPRHFSEREKRLALGVGDYVLGALVRIRAREESEAARQRAEAFAEQVQQLAVLEERNRLARELHDSVSQALYGIVLGAQTARTFLDRDPSRAVDPLDYVLSLSEAGLAEMRALIFELRPETLEKEGLIEALSKQVTMLRARHGLAVNTHFGLEPDMPLKLKEAAYWIAREALYNVVKHAHASTVEIQMSTSDDSFSLTVCDDGLGFNTDGDFSGHLGIKSMTERAQKIGGVLRVVSHPGDGTRIELSCRRSAAP